MKKIIYNIITYIVLFFNSNLYGDQNNQTLKVGLLAPLTGEYKDLGNSLLYSLQLALEEINDKNVIIIPRDSGFQNKKKLISAIQDIKSSGANVIIGPVSNKFFGELKKFKDIVFISPSNIKPEFSDNIISIGVSLESQLMSIKNFIKKQKKKTIIMFPNNQYADLIENKLKEFDLDNSKIFKYTPDPQVLTGEIEKFTNYSQRKKNLELRKKCLRIKRMRLL